MVTWLMATKLTDKSALIQGLVWVLLTYPDGSEFCFQTTLNPQLLNSYGVVLEEGKLARLDKQYIHHGAMVYRQFPHAGAVLSLWSECHYEDAESAKLHDFM